jgi:REP element-mobilizing transposase RayT
MSVKHYRRADGPDRIFHITSRVNWQVWHLDEHAPKALLAELIREAAERFGVTILAGVLMSNHIHLVVQSPPPALYRRLTGRVTSCRHFRAWPDGHANASVLSQFMRRIRHCMSIRRQSELDLTGRFWDSPFHATPVIDPLSLAVRIAYDHRNPVKANMVQDPEDYEWSSAAEWATGTKGRIPIWLDGTLPFGLSKAELRELVFRYQQPAMDLRGDELAEVFQMSPEESAAALRKLLEDHGLL